MLQLRKILAGTLIAYGTGVILWVAHSFTQALVTEHIRVDLVIASYALAILLVFFGVSSVAIGVWHQRRQQWVFRVVIAVAVALILASGYAIAVINPSRLMSSLTFLALFSVPPLAIETYLLQPVRSAN